VHLKRRIDDLRHRLTTTSSTGSADRRHFFAGGGIRGLESKNDRQLTAGAGSLLGREDSSQAARREDKKFLAGKPLA
jgi:hypothetical protein